MVHGDAVVGVGGELVQGQGRGAVHGLVVGLEVGDERPHGVQRPELVAVVVPAAAVGDGRPDGPWRLGSLLGALQGA